MNASARGLQAGWTDDATLHQTINVPWGTVTGAEALGTYAAEALLHSWDLAVAIGVEPNWPQPDTSVHYEMAQSAFPGHGRGEFIPFHDAAADPGPDAAVIDRLAAWMGRDAKRWRAGD